MKMNGNAVLKRTVFLLFLGFLSLLMVPNALAGEYDNALKGVKGIDVIYDVSIVCPLKVLILWIERSCFPIKKCIELFEYYLN